MQDDPIRVPFDQKVYGNTGVLGPDNTLKIMLASWLNTTGKPIHMEATFVVVYRFEAIAAVPKDNPNSCSTLPARIQTEPQGIRIDLFTHDPGISVLGGTVTSQPSRQ